MKTINLILYNGIMNVKYLMIGLIIIMFSGCVLAGLTSCKSVRKSQNEKLEQSTVKKSDSSSSKSYSYVDTTKTDSSTTITKTEVTIDSIEWSDGLGIGYEVTTELLGPDLSKGYNTIGVPNEPWVIRPDIAFKAPTSKAKAKGIKIVTTKIEQAAKQDKGVAIKADVKQADIKTEEKFAKRELSKETVKKPSINMGIGLVFGIAILIGLIWLVIWVYRKKRKAIDLVTGKIF